MCLGAILQFPRFVICNHGVLEMKRSLRNFTVKMEEDENEDFAVQMMDSPLDRLNRNSRGSRTEEGDDEVMEIGSASTVDLTNPSTAEWLKRIGLWEFAYKPWKDWEVLEEAEAMLEMLQKGEGDSWLGEKVTPEVISEAFGLPLVENRLMTKMTDHILRAEFRAPTGAKHYYVVQQPDLLRRRHVNGTVVVTTKLNTVEADMVEVDLRTEPIQMLGEMQNFAKERLTDVTFKQMKLPSWEYGLRKSFRQRLPIVPFDEKFLSSSQDTQCTVCLGDYQDGEKIQKLPACNHSFHVQCIDEWLTKNVTCPICRTSVLSEDGSVGFVDERPCEDGQSLDRTSGEEHRRWEERVVSEAQDQSHVIRIDNSDDITSDDVQASEITVGCWPAGEPAPNIERS
ncbi:hypothetical protein L7F22_021632 [Adiantum nelumboides]|nr:hypothetical protein [Adiantum nelumboides]